MKTEEDEAFDDLAKRQGSWGGGFPAKRKMAADKQHWNEDEWRRNNWRCSHGWLRGEQCESCNAPQPAQEPEREALKLALEALDNLMYWDNGKPDYDEAREAITAIKEALAQPPQRTWIWLSDADIAEVVDTTCQYTGGYEEYLIKKAERKIRSMNT